MKKRDIIIVTISIAIALICVVLTWLGNYKNEGVLSPDAFYGVLAAFIGVCATIIVGFQIASFIKIQETERQIMDVQKERDEMLKEKEEFLKDMNQIKIELSNSFHVLFMTLPNDEKSLPAKIFVEIVSITLMDLKEAPEITLNKYKNLEDLIRKAPDETITELSRFVNKLKRMNIPSDINHHTEIMRLHWGIIDILDKVKKK